MVCQPLSGPKTMWHKSTIGMLPDPLPLLERVWVRYYMHTCFPPSLPPVLGPMDPSDLGVTLPHEHLLLDFTVALMDPEYCRANDLIDLELKMENLGKIRQFPYGTSLLPFPTTSIPTYIHTRISDSRAASVAQLVEHLPRAQSAT